MKAVCPPLPSNHNQLKEPMLRKEHVSFHTFLNAHEIPLTCLGFALFCYIKMKSYYTHCSEGFPLKYYKYYFRTIHIDPVHFFFYS